MRTIGAEYAIFGIILIASLLVAFIIDWIAYGWDVND